MHLLRRLVVVLALVLGLASHATVAHAAETLTVTPKSGKAGSSVTLRYDTNAKTPNGCPQNTGVQFFFEDAPVGSRQQMDADCGATLQTTVPQTSCGKHDFNAAYYWYDQQQQEALYGRASVTFTVTCTGKPSPTLPVVIPTIGRTPSPTPSPTASPTPSPTPSPTATPSATPTATPTATGTPAALSTASAAPGGVARVPGDLDEGGSGTPWVVGGALLGLAGLGVSLGLLRPRGAGTPVVVGTAVLSVLAGTAVALKPLTDPPPPVVLGTYDAGQAACAAGDLPLTGGFHALDTPSHLLHHEPRGDSSGGFWDGTASGAGESYTLCLRFGKPVSWQVRSKALAGDPPRGGPSCLVDEQLMGGGSYVPWGYAGREGSHPDAPGRWSVVTGREPADLPPISAFASALCAALPDGVKTYTTSGSAPGPGTATAHCFPGDAVLNGGYEADHVLGSHPVDGGWAAEVGAGGGKAYALCYKPGATIGLRTSHVRTDEVTGAFQGTADCDSGDQLLGGGWRTGTGIGGLQHFRPQGRSWVVALPSRGDVTAYALCARKWRA